MLLKEIMRVPVADGELHVERAGEGSAVVLLHSGTTDAGMWDPQVEALARLHTVVTFDARGHGRSTTPTGDWRPDDDLLAVLDALELPSVHLVGNSYGGATSADFALVHPERVRSMVLSGPGIYPMRFDDPFVQHHHRMQAEAVAAQDAAGYVEAFLRLAVDGPHRTPEQVPAGVREACRAMATRTVANHHAAQGRPLVRDAGDRLEAVAAPTLLVLGELEISDLQRVVADAHRRMPRAERVDMPGVGHMTNMERPQEFTDVVLAHLDRHR